MKTRHYIITFMFAILPFVAMSQELKVQSFTLSSSEIISSGDQRKDLNGMNCALVKVQVVDGIDRVEGNIIGDIDSRGTEKRIYLTQGTKTFRLHPHSYLPVTITTSEFDIENLEGNRVYILRLTGDMIEKEAKAEPKKETKQEEPREQQTDIYQDQTSGYSDYYYQQQPSKPVKTSYFSDAEFHVYAGVGFNAVSTMGPSVHLGASYGMFSLEGGFVYGMDKVEDIHLSVSSTISEAYDYSCSKVWARLGVNFDIEQFRISPQAGLTFNMISGKDASGASNTTDYFKSANPMSAFAAVRLSYEVAEHFYVHITPQYDFSIGGDEIFEVIKQGDSKIKTWGEGFGVNAGIIYEF